MYQIIYQILQSLPHIFVHFHFTQNFYWIRNFVSGCDMKKLIERIHHVFHDFYDATSTVKAKQGSGTFQATAQKRKIEDTRCIFCSSWHKTSISQRYSTITPRKDTMQYNCLKRNHDSSNCRFQQATSKYCQGSHNCILCAVPRKTGTYSSSYFSSLRGNTGGIETFRSRYFYLWQYLKYNCASRASPFCLFTLQKYVRNTFVLKHTLHPFFKIFLAKLQITQRHSKLEVF